MPEERNTAIFSLCYRVPEERNTAIFRSCRVPSRGVRGTHPSLIPQSGQLYDCILVSRSDLTIMPLAEGNADNTIALSELAAQLLETQQRLAQFEAERHPVRDPVVEPRVEAYRSPKIPSFFRSDPAVWFMQVEASLRNARITVESTKAYFVSAAVDAEVVACVKDIVSESPPSSDVYQRIKSRVIATFACSAESNLRKLLKGQVPTDGKPSLVLSRLRNLNVGKCDDAVIRSIFLEQLPANHRAILAATGSDDLDRLAEIADKIADHSGPVETHIASATKTPSPPALEEEVTRLAACVAALTKQVEKLSTQQSVSW